MHLSGHKSRETTLGLSLAIGESDGGVKCAAALWDRLSACLGSWHRGKAELLCMVRLEVVTHEERPCHRSGCAAPEPKSFSRLTVSLKEHKSVVQRP